MAGLSNTDRQNVIKAARQQLDGAAFGQALATAALVPIAESVIEQAKFRQLLLTDRFENGPTITYQLKKRAKAWHIPRYGAPPEHLVRYTRFQVSPWMISVSPKISVLDIEDANFNVISDILADAGKEISVQEDKEGFSLFDAAATLPGTSWPTSGDEWMEASDGPDGTTVLDTNVVRLDEDSLPSAQDLILLGSYVEMIGYEIDTFLMNPYTFVKLSATEEFLLYINAGGNAVLQKGFFESALGKRFVTSRLCGQRDIWALDSSEAAVFAERNALTSADPKTEKLVMSWFLWERVAIFIKNANAMARLSYKETA